MAHCSLCTTHACFKKDSLRYCLKHLVQYGGFRCNVVSEVEKICHCNDNKVSKMLNYYFEKYPIEVCQEKDCTIHINKK